MSPLNRPPISRRRTRIALVGGIQIGGGAPIVVQSMTNTDTADIGATVTQVKALADAGSELVRIAVNTAEAAAAVPAIREQLDAMSCKVPLIGDFHFNGHKLLSNFPDCARALAKYRINPGNVGKGTRHDPQFAVMIERAIDYGKPVRIGVNWGSLDQDLLASLMDENARSANPLDAAHVMREALVTFRDPQRAVRRGAGLARRSHHPGVQGVERAGPDRRLYRARATLRLSAAPRPHRSRHGQQGHRRVDGRARRAAAAGHRRHDPHLPHAGAERRSHARGDRRAGDPADDGPALLLAAGERVPGLRPHDERVLPGARRQDPVRICARRCPRGASSITASRT